MTLRELLKTCKYTLVRCVVFDNNCNIVQAMSKPSLGDDTFFKKVYVDYLDYEVDFIRAERTKEWMCIMVALMKRAEDITEYDCYFTEVR